MTELLTEKVKKIHAEMLASAIAHNRGCNCRCKEHSEKCPAYAIDGLLKENEEGKKYIRQLLEEAKVWAQSVQDLEEEARKARERKRIE